MTYFEFLLLFIIIPLIFFLILNILQKSRDEFSVLQYSGIIGLSVIALIYTTPWDNYLVAEAIWFYDEALVTGLTIGWVPIEEYTFFIVQTILTGVIFVWVIKNTDFSKHSDQIGKKSNLIRLVSLLFIVILWIPMFFILVFKLDESLTYLSLILAWGLIPIGLQLIYGGDIIWKHKKVVFGLITVIGSYLSLIDAFAIDSGIWTITQSTSLGILIGGILPIEEAIFFFLTTSLVIFSMILFFDRESVLRAKKMMV